MRWTFDADSDAFYFRVTEQPASGQRELGDGVVVDVDEAGGVVGVEFLAGLVELKAVHALRTLVDEQAVRGMLWVMSNPPVPSPGPGAVGFTATPTNSDSFTPPTNTELVPA